MKPMVHMKFNKEALPVKQMKMILEWRWDCTSQSLLLRSFTILIRVPRIRVVLKSLYLVVNDIYKPVHI